MIELKAIILLLTGATTICKGMIHYSKYSQKYYNRSAIVIIDNDKLVAVTVIDI